MARTAASRAKSKSSVSDAKAKRKTRKSSKKDSEVRKPRLVKTRKSEYQVEYILYADVARGRGATKDRHWQYKVKWLNYPDSDNTWETEASFKGDIIDDFWKDVEQSTTGEEVVRDAREHRIGKRYTPSGQWIKRMKLEAAQAAKAAA